MNNLARFAAVALVLTPLASPASANDVRVVDGDTIKIDGTTYRLWGIDAPETKQMCGDQAGGLLASGTLKELIRGHQVTCEPRTTDRYGRTVALCRADGMDLSAAMVQSGAAYAFVRYSHDYVALEEKARAENIGVHAFRCDLPWEWRARSRGDR